MKYVNTQLFPSLHIEATICESTAVQWLKRLGFKHDLVRKGVYVDGHERDDVKAARKDFIDYMENEVFPYV